MTRSLAIIANNSAIIISTIIVIISHCPWFLGTAISHVSRLLAIEAWKRFTSLSTTKIMNNQRTKSYHSLLKWPIWPQLKHFGWFFCSQLVAKWPGWLQTKQFLFSLVLIADFDEEEEGWKDGDLLLSFENSLEFALGFARYAVSNLFGQPDSGNSTSFTDDDDNCLANPLFNEALISLPLPLVMLIISIIRNHPGRINKMKN